MKIGTYCVHGWSHLTYGRAIQHVIICINERRGRSHTLLMLQKVHEGMREEEEEGEIGRGKEREECKGGRGRDG